MLDQHGGDWQHVEAPSAGAIVQTADDNAQVDGEHAQFGGTGNYRKLEWIVFYLFFYFQITRDKKRHMYEKVTSAKY